MSSSDLLSSKQAGVSVLEALLVLTIMSLTVASLASTGIGPSQQLERGAEISKLLASLNDTRALAISSNEPKTAFLDWLSCSGDEIEIKFNADGTTDGNSYCVLLLDKAIRVSINPLTGIAQQLDTDG